MYLLLIFLAGANLALLYALMAAPVGVRTVRVARRIAAPRERLWSALWPFGANAGWSGEIVEARAIGDAGASIRLSWEGRDGQPICRQYAFDNIVDGASFESRIVDDSSLDPEFWRSYRESLTLVDADGGTDVVLTRTDRYRGVAFWVFRHFALRREVRKLRIWAETGAYKSGGVFEHPISQIGFALLSALVLWPFFGLTANGLMLSLVLTCAVALHELGHMAAFRVMGHRRTRMIFIPLLGGLAIGGRPYDTRFEVAFVALMGAGFSAFLVPIGIAGSIAARNADMPGLAQLFWALAGCIALFNLANLIPVWKFDGGQVLRQIISAPALLAGAAFAMLSAFMALGHLLGLAPEMLVVCATPFAILGLVTSGTGVKPKHALRAIAPIERSAIGAGLVATLAIHGLGALWAAEQFRGGHS